MKYFIIAGEASGDLHGSNLMQEIRIIDQEAEFMIVGGDLMYKHGGNLILHYREMAFMGLWEVIRNIFMVFRNFRICKRNLMEYSPDAVILIDYPGFNLRMAKFASRRGYRVIYYISPKIWAWNSKRVHAIRKYVRHMLTILPFEKGFYKNYGVQVDYVGNPLLDAIQKEQESLPGLNQFIRDHQLDQRPVIALLAGSRRHEIASSLPVMRKMTDYFPNYQFVVASVPSVEPEFYDQFLAGSDIKRITGQTYALLSNAWAAIVNSGTASLETALFEVPQVVCYRMAGFTAFLARMVIKVPYASLVNLILNRLAVKELIQENFREDKLREELTRIAGDPEYRREIISSYRELKDMLGQSGASARAAKLIYKYSQGGDE